MKTLAATALATESEFLLVTSLNWKLDAKNSEVPLPARLRKNGKSFILQLPSEDKRTFLRP
jgi:hypothetical protein